MPPIVLTATYRVQLTSNFGFARAAAIVPYLDRLGISHLYASPFLTAQPTNRPDDDSWIWPNVIRIRMLPRARRRHPSRPQSPRSRAEPT